MKGTIYTVGLTGGIGSGKSTLAAMLEKRGGAVYYADPRAKELMNTDHILVENIKNLLGEQAYIHGQLDRRYVAERVFLDAALLDRLNAIVHPATYMDFEHWRLCVQAPYVILESAILFESGGDKRCDVTVAVCIPENIRIGRVAERDGVSEEAVRARMGRQMTDEQRAALADIVVSPVDFEEKEREADRLDAFFRHADAKG